MEIQDETAGILEPPKWKQEYTQAQFAAQSHTTSLLAREQGRHDTRIQAAHRRIDELEAELEKFELQMRELRQRLGKKFKEIEDQVNGRENQQQAEGKDGGA